jgi:hypothetical protein
MFYVYRVEDKITKEYYIGSRKYNGKNIETDFLGWLKIVMVKLYQLIKKILYLEKNILVLPKVKF